ncbi:uncharacterized protein LOC129001688 [Macrosteles quadrilineatus]|uniref:uncharacterized protein LOC129001688 n=1 Tax=Macrosteles quadrilineatus TaxID=74068 RepID=UPI0023E24E8B|nr:uncharacterized protein LOC129001688 [Macrosteles quadrilineatus]
MTASVLSSIFLLFFPIVCNAGQYAVLIENMDKIQAGSPKELYQYEIRSNKILCAVYEAPFVLDPGLMALVQFNSIAFVHDLLAKKLLRAFANNNCDDFATNLYANGHLLEFRHSSGSVATITYVSNYPSQGGQSFRASTWKKFSCALTSGDPSKIDTICKNPREETFPPPKSANSRVTVKRPAGTSQPPPNTSASGRSTKRYKSTDQQPGSSTSWRY